MIAVLLTLAACTGAATDAPTSTPVKLALNWYPEPEFGGFYEGVLSGAYAEAGFDVVLLPGGPGAPSLELLATGRADAAISSADDLLIKRARGIQAVGAWPGFQLTPAGLMVHADGPASFEDIQGGQVAIEVGAPFQVYLWKTFGWEGEVEAIPYGGGVGPFLADPALIQQGYITSEPCLARAKGAEVRFLKLSDAGWNPYSTLLTFADPPPPWAADFVAVTQRAWEAYLADPARAHAELARLNDQMTPALLDCIFQAQGPFVTGADGLGAMNAARWDAMAATLAAQGLLPEGATAAGAWKALR
ncbi:MAG: ABC transporter substrate-binding protein [Alphaproteobacteria bacterium]|nr:ABC transporter substrate-binding protein [Alphaproteobacteria bacterium]